MTSTPPEAQKRPIMARSNGGSFFLGCFRPPVVDTRDVRLGRMRSAPLKARDAERAVLTYIAFDDYDGKDGRGLRRIVPCGARERLVRATKAVFLDMALVRKVRKKRHPRKTEEPSRHPCKKPGRILRSMSERTHATRDDSWEEPGKRGSDVSTSVSATPLSWTGWERTPSRDSSTNSLDCRSSRLPNQERPPSLATSPLYLILLALALLIVWGKVCAIVCTSACLASSLPTWATRTDGNPGQHSRDKKRVVMEGLLQRGHRHHPPAGRRRWSA
ncbi:hypothetical protein MLD38_035224 [Melastoma candidum]|uniref:Uncharacterized protein n=1 Tax=Melastoma candidum TaxID=119954 RepID=A0ACB9MCE8_9MYRT|nr:hypothetical protein MLD38_035224 [Melastoma candidum]